MNSRIHREQFLPYGRQCIGEEEIAAVSAVLRGDFLTTGSAVEEFERSFAAYVGAKHAIAVNSGTAALHVAVSVGGIRRGDRILTSPNTFVASANAAAFVGASPDFADIDERSYNLSLEALQDAWKSDVKAVIPVAYAGQPCDMPAIADFARSRGALVIEDASHAVGSRFRWQFRDWRLGGHPWADMTVFSFHPVKTITTGEGGMLVTDNDSFAAAARKFRTHGIDRVHFEGISGDAVLSEQGPWYYEMQDLGWNYRITDLQCALGQVQLGRLHGFIARRQSIVRRYNEALAGIPWLQTPAVIAPAVPELISWHLYSVQIDFQSLGLTRSEAMARLRQAGVGSQVLYIPVYLQPWYRKTYGYAPGKCPSAERFYRRSLSLPLYPTLSDDDVERVITAVKSLCQ